MTTDNSIWKAEIKENRIKLFSFVIAVGLCVLFCGYFWVSGSSLSEQSYEIKLNEKINPNYAPVASLTRLPGIGIGRAKAIVDYRENFKEENDGHVFRNCDDLQKVKGIGPKIAQNISEWLKFE